MATTKQSPSKKPITLKVVRTSGGYAVYSLKNSIHPSAVFKTPWEVLDWLAEQLVDLEGASVVCS